MNNKDKLIDYDEICKIYDDVRDGDMVTARHIIEKTGVGSNSKILEIGCGTGNYAVLLYELTGADVWGVDQSEGMLERAKAKNMALNLIKGDAVMLDSIPNGEFDLVYMVDVIHHIKDIETMFKNIRRVLKRNGCLMIFTDSHEHIKKRLTTKYFPETLEVELNRYQAAEEIAEVLHSNGFHSVKADVVTIGDDENFGIKFIEIAQSKGYSMFNLISQEAIDKGIARIKEDMKIGKIVYHMEAPYIYALKV